MEKEKNYKGLYEKQLDLLLALQSVIKEELKTNIDDPVTYKAVEKLKMMSDEERRLLEIYMDSMIADYTYMTQSSFTETKNNMSLATYLQLRDQALFEMAIICKTGSIKNYGTRVVEKDDLWDKDIVKFSDELLSNE